MNASGWTLSDLDPSSEGHAGAWREVVMRAGASLVHWPEFVFSCARTLAGAPLRMALHRRAGEVTAATILDRRRFLPEVFVESQMPLGAWIQLPSESFVSLAQDLLRELPLGARIGIAQLDERSVPRPGTSQYVNTRDYMDTPWLEVVGDYESYWAGRGKNLRTNMRRQREKLAKNGIVTRMETLTDVTAMHSAIGDYAALEAKGWKMAGGTAVSEDHPQIRFYRAVFEEFARLGFARIYRYFFSDRLVACELCLCGNGEFVILKTTYDESTAPYSPASLLRQEMFEEIFRERRVQRIEFYGPLKEWHTRWTGTRRGIYHANVFACSPVGKFAGFVQTRLRREI